MSTTVIQTLAEYQVQIWSLGTVIFSALVARLLRLRPKLFYSIGHSTNLLVDQPLLDPQGVQISPRQLVRTASITISNGGLQPAKNVEVTFNWRPPILNISPARAFSNIDSPFDRYSVRFDSLAPHEQITLEIMSINAELPLMTSVRSEDCVAKMINMTPQRVWPNWFNISVGILLLLGMTTAIYLVIAIVQLAINH